METITTTYHSNLLFKLPKIGSLFSGSFRLLRENDPLRMAAATAFFTTFAFPPILMILIRLFGLFMDRKEFAAGLFKRMGTVLDPSSIGQIMQTLKNIRNLQHTWYATTLSFIFFLFVASTLFNIIKNTVDQIWCFRMKEKMSFSAAIAIRLKSIAVILLAGVLFLGGLVIESARTYLSDYVGKNLDNFLNQVVFIAISTVWFMVLFRMLASGRPAWKMAFWGGLVTGILFNIGKYLVQRVLIFSNIGPIYGASGSVVLIMLFVFYSSFIFYFGACFVKVISEAYKCPIAPVVGASKYELRNKRF